MLYELEFTNNGDPRVGRRPQYFTRVVNGPPINRKYRTTRRYTNHVHNSLADFADDIARTTGEGKWEIRISMFTPTTVCHDGQRLNGMINPLREYTFDVVYAANPHNPNR